MIKNIIFDLGDVFINLDHSKSETEMLKLGIQKFTDEMLDCNVSHEKGLISTEEFLSYYKDIFSKLSNEQFIDSWNSIINDFPKYRLSFLEKIQNNYRLFLLSNTNELHIEYFKNLVGYDFYTRFVDSFEKIYYSHLIHHRKPEKESFELIIQENKLKVAETLFVDDSLINIIGAKKLGLKTWHLIPVKEDVVNMYEIKNSLFGQQKVGT
ncbi:MAG: HAD family phosphatase [Flavobacteriaceae bacterium]|nr:HAD family phosphatase [Flavobacteriaceae bacterium]